QEYAAKWPNITRMGEIPADADDWRETPNKLKDHFSPEPAKR
ncbi:MAG: DUF3470 domain-containing protein, partial [Alphaproteobacteria bacterium]|nr:DUF3470 domain-containing protein [Alphaproteobacteria bacterium]